MINLPPTQILISFNYWRTFVSCSSKFLTLCVFDIEVGLLSAWNLEFYCINDVWLARRQATFTGKVLMKDFTWVKIPHGSNTSFQNFSCWNTASSIWEVFCRFSLHEGLTDFRSWILWEILVWTIYSTSLNLFTKVIYPGFTTPTWSLNYFMLL